MVREWTVNVCAGKWSDEGEVALQIIGPGGNRGYPHNPVRMSPDESEQLGITLIQEADKARRMKRKRRNIRSVA